MVEGDCAHASGLTEAATLNGLCVVSRRHFQSEHRMDINENIVIKEKELMMGFVFEGFPKL